MNTNQKMKLSPEYVEAINKLRQPDEDDNDVLRRLIKDLAEEQGITLQ